MVTLERTLVGLREIVNKYNPMPVKENDFGVYLKKRVERNIELYEYVKKNYPAIDKFSLKGIVLTHHEP